MLELLTWRTESITRAPKREIRFLPALRSIHAQVWRAVFGKQADAIEKSVENDDECASSGAVSVPAYLYLSNYHHGNTVLMIPALCMGFADMIIDNDPPITRHISVPRDMSQLSCSALTAGIVEAVLDGLGFVRMPLSLLVTSIEAHRYAMCSFPQPARVTAHSVPTDQYPQRTTILIKLDKSVMEREEALK